MAPQNTNTKQQKLLQTLRRQFCSDEGPHEAGIAIGRELAMAFRNDDDEIWEILNIEGLQPIVIYTILMEIINHISKELLSHWLVQWDTTSSANTVRRDACLCAMAVSSNLDCPFRSVWSKLSRTTKMELCVEMISHASLEDAVSSSSLTGLFHCILVSPEEDSSLLIATAVRTLHTRLWNLNATADHDDHLSQWLEALVSLYELLPYRQKDIAQEWLEMLLELQNEEDTILIERHLDCVGDTDVITTIGSDTECLRMLGQSLADARQRVVGNVFRAFAPTTPAQEVFWEAFRSIRKHSTITSGKVPHTDSISFERDSECWRYLFQHSEVLLAEHLSIAQQSMVLLLGEVATCHWMKVALQRYPALGISVAPRWHQRLECTEDSTQLLMILDVLWQACGHPVAAQWIWNAHIQYWVSEHAPDAVRHTVLRRLPDLIRINPRLRNRIISLLIREPPSVLVSATLAELAEQDLIRDVTEIIGTVQSFLEYTGGREFVTYYALMCLYHLVSQEELDFDVVVKVLQTKLCTMRLDEIRKLPNIVQEGLVQFFGSGAASMEDSEHDDDTNRSPQVRLAMECLLGMGNVRLFQPIPRVQKAIFTSLSKYSLAAIGISEEDIQNSVHTSTDGPPTIATQLRDLVFSGLSTTSDGTSQDTEEETECSVVVLASRFMEYEEEVLGPSLWHGSKATTAVQRGSLASRISELPTVPPNEMLSDLLLEVVPSMESVRDMMEELVDAMMTMMMNPLDVISTLQGLILILHKIHVMEIETDVDHVEAIQNWDDDDQVSEDAIVIALACYMCVEPLATEERKVVVRNVLRDFSSAKFENMELIKVALGLMGAALVSTGDLSLTSKIIDVLNDSMTGYGGCRSFGGFYALSLIAQGSTQRIDGAKSGPYDSVVIGISRTLLSELYAVFEMDDGAEALWMKALDEDVISDELRSSLDSLNLKVKTLEGTSLSIQYCFPLIYAPLAVKRPDFVPVLRRLLSKAYGDLEMGSGVAHETASVSHEDVGDIDYGKLPAPQSGSLVALVMEGLRRTLALPPSVEHTAFLRRAFLSLDKLSIPESYCKGMLVPLIDNVEYRSMAIKLLFSQISIRRRAYSSGTAFIAQAVTFCQQKTDVWNIYSIETISDILIKFGDIGPRIPVQHFESVVSQLWQTSVQFENNAVASLRILFLQSLTKISKNARSRQHIATTRTFAIQTVFRTFSNKAMETWTASLNNDSVSLLKAAAMFLNQIPTKDFLDDSDFVQQDVSPTNIVSCGFHHMVMLQWVTLEPQLKLQRSIQVQKYVQSYIVKVLAVPKCPSGLLHRLFMFQTAVLEKSLVQLDPIYELLLVVDSTQKRRVFQWLAQICQVMSDPSMTQSVSPVVFFGNGIDAVEKLMCMSDNGLAEYYHDLLDALPERIAGITQRDKTATKTSNQLARVLDQCDEEHDTDLIRLLIQMMIRCHDPASVQALTIMEHLSKNPLLLLNL